MVPLITLPLCCTLRGSLSSLFPPLPTQDSLTSLWTVICDHTPHPTRIERRKACACYKISAACRAINKACAHCKASCSDLVELNFCFTYRIREVLHLSGLRRRLSRAPNLKVASKVLRPSSSGEPPVIRRRRRKIRSYSVRNNPIGRFLAARTMSDICKPSHSR
jgi:hypothetical protein